MADLTGIAIVGMAGRFGGAGSIAAFWRGLCAGEEFIRTIPEDELRAAGVPAADLADTAYVRRRAVLADPAGFAAEFFGIAPREAEVMDPQHRVFLETAWEALEDAGCDPSRYPGLIGVFGSASTNTYRINVDRHAELARTTGVIQADVGCEIDYLATRVSYQLDLRGPSVSVQTACSSSLVAVHMAVQSLHAMECDAALAGGVAIQLPQVGYRYQDGGIASPDGRCRAFDAAAGGTVGGDGVGVVVLKRLADAVADADQVHAVILGSAVNNDGRAKVGFTAPSIQGQAEVIAEAQAVAGVEPREIGYVEGHGTGTVLGDPIEARALTRAFRAGTDDRGFCALGSVKTNVGHLDVAAGMAGLIKAALALRYRRIPPTLHHTRANPECELADSPFYINTEPIDWPASDGTRRAGVSAFGIGGTNAHLVLGEAPAPAPVSAVRPGHLLLVSAKTGSALERAAANLTAHLAAHPDEDVADIAHTLRVGREQFDRRLAIVCADRADALSGTAEIITGRPARPDRPVLFLFPGQGAQHARMGAGLYAHEPVFRHWVDHCCDLLVPELGVDLRTRLYGPDTGELDRTALAQPALFVTSYALAQTWLAWGVEPAAMLGHSLGEYVAACLAGVFGLADALRLVAVRARLMGDTDSGAMLGVHLPADELAPLLTAGVALASVNAPAECVASGPVAEIDALRVRLDRAGVTHRALHTAHAFHSASQDPVVEKLVAVIADIPRHPPTRAYLSNVTGDWITAAECTDTAYWGRQLREPVRFSAGLCRVIDDDSWALLEIGPGTGLGNLARQHVAITDQPVIASMRHPRDGRDDRATLLRAVARLWVAGVGIDWTGYAGAERRHTVSLPTYPFERQRYWIGETQRERQAYPRPDRLDRFVPPDGPLQNRIAAIWRDVIGIDRIGGSDDFFELGGSSLVATQVVARLGDAFDIDVPIEMLFERTTVAALADGVEGLLLDRLEAMPGGDQW